MFYFDPTFLLLIPGIIFTFYAQSKVKSAYNEYSRIRTRSGITGAEAAQRIMASNGLSGIPIRQIPGEMSDNYSPKDKVMNLSQPVAYGDSIASIGIAAHETGHALQDKENYFLLRFRNFIVPISGFCSAAAWPLFFIGLLFARSSQFGYLLMDLGIILFLGALIFYIITLPVEFNASKRAITQIENQNILDQEELQGVKKVLTAAALTYVASMLMSLLNLFRLLAIRGRQ